MNHVTRPTTIKTPKRIEITTTREGVLLVGVGIMGAGARAEEGTGVGMVEHTFTDMPVDN